MNYLLMLRDPNEFRFDTTFVSEVLSEMSCDYIITKDLWEDSIHSEKISVDSNSLEISINKDGETLVFSGQWDLIPRFLKSTSEKIPNSENAVFFDEGYSNNIQINSDLEISDIEEAFSN